MRKHDGICCGGWRASVILLLLLSVPAGAVLAQERGAVTEPTAPSAMPAPARQPGLLESFGRWVEESAAGMRKSFEGAWRGAATQGDAATKASTDATANIAKGAIDAAKGTADALGKFGTARVVSGRERCAVASNGAPDCRAAVETLCRSKGFNSGNSVDFETSERCSAQAMLSGRKGPGDCSVQHVVTKAMCQ